MNQSCQIEHGASDSDVGTPCSNRAVATCADCGAAICSDCRMWCCGQSFCQWCGDYHTTLYLNLKPSVSDGGAAISATDTPRLGQFFQKRGFFNSHRRFHSQPACWCSGDVDGESTLTIRIAKQGILDVLFVIGLLSLPLFSAEKPKDAVPRAP